MGIAEKVFNNRDTQEDEKQTRKIVKVLALYETGKKQRKRGPTKRKKTSKKWSMERKASV